MRRYYTHTCLQCGTAFESLRKNTKYCSTKCAGNAKSLFFAEKRKSVCLWCGKEFIAKKKRNSSYCSPECYFVSQREECLSRFNNIDGFYLVNYSSKDEVTIACSVCGTEYTTTSTEAIRKRACQNCAKIEADRKEKEKLEQLQAKRKAREDAKRKKDEQLKKLREQKNVEREKMHQEALKRQKERLHAYWKDHELDRENRIKSNGRRDRGITLQKLYSRDGGRCHICGGICDFSDGTWTNKGYFIARASYPSIDHIVPLSLGGPHTWDNIKLAHFRCNVIRGNAPLRKEGA